MMLFLLYLYFLAQIVSAYPGESNCKQEAPKVCDFIVVGAGAAGATLAARLSEEPKFTVCLYEAGSKDYDREFASAIETPRLLTSLGPANIKWNTSTVPQKELNGRKIKNGMGKAFGGSTTHNGFAYFRGYKADFDYWAAKGATGWEFESVLPFYLKSENISIPELRKSPYHSTCGPLSISRSARIFDTEFWKLWARTTNEVSLSIGECNGPLPPGLCPIQWTIRNGKRESTSTAFLRPAMGRNNLFVVSEALVERVLISRRNKAAYGIVFHKHGRVYSARARREVIISAGTFETPKLLQLSGIGPKSALKKLKIFPHIYLPVGENLQDHILLPFDLEVNIPTVTSESLADPAMLAQYIFQNKGLWSESSISLNVFYDITVQKYNWPDIYFQIWDVQLEDGIINIQTGQIPAISRTKKRNATTMFLCLSHPTSRGTIRAKSTDPRDAPLIDPKYLSKSDDIRTLIKGIRIVQRILKAPSMRKVGATFTIRNSGLPNQNVTEICSVTAKYDSDGFWACVLRQQTTTGIHPVGSCSIGNRRNRLAVVDPKLRVRGIKGLRVADASVMPEITSANTQAPSIMIGERAADFIKKDYIQYNRY